TGIAGTLLTPLEEISYMYWSRASRARVAKTVAFYLLAYRAGYPPPRARVAPQPRPGRQDRGLLPAGLPPRLAGPPRRRGRRGPACAGRRRAPGAHLSRRAEGHGARPGLARGGRLRFPGRERM